MYQAEVQRMDLAHEKFVAPLQQNMTMRSAFAYLQKNPKATPELLQLVPDGVDDYQDVYIVSELMQTDLRSVLRGDQTLTDDHHEFSLHLLPRGLTFMSLGRGGLPRFEAWQLACQQRLRTQDLRLWPCKNQI